MTTNCVFPPELDDKQLLAYLDDPDANLETAHHLEKCPYCRERAETLDRLQKRLTARLYRATCPSPMELGEFHLQMLTASRRLVIGQHLRQCPLCTMEVSRLKENLSEFEPQRNLLESVQLFMADLVVGRKTARGERGVDSGPFIYQVEDLRFSINVDDDTEEPGLKTMLGLVEGLGSGEGDLTMEAYREGKLLTKAPIDEFNYFSFTHLPPGSYDLVLSGLQTEIRLAPPLEVL